jgi:hypothetical protein
LISAMAGGDFANQWVREELVEHRTTEILKQQGTDPENATEAQEEAARAQASEQVAAMSDDQLRRAYEEYEKQAEAAWKREAVIDYLTEQNLTAQRIDPEEATEIQENAARAQARRQVAAMSEAELERHYKEYEEAEDARFETAMAEAREAWGADRDDSDEEDEGLGMSTGRWGLLAALFFGWYGLLFLGLAMFTAYKVGSGGAGLGGE